MTLSWTQPLCDSCWCAMDRREPNRMAPSFREQEICAKCGTETSSGIYRRMDPSKVPFPAGENP